MSESVVPSFNCAIISTVFKGHARAPIHWTIGISTGTSVLQSSWRASRLNAPPKPLDGLRRLLDAPKGDNPAAVRDRAILALMGRHGLRVSEVAGLTVDAVDFDAGTVKVVGKGRKSRTVYLTEASAAALSRWLDIRESVANPGEPALFVSLDRAHRGGGMSARAIRYMVDGYLEALGLKAEGISCHSLRHSAATWARAGGAKLDALADMMGHADVSTTRIHAQIVNKMTENPARFLEAMLTTQALV